MTHIVELASLFPWECLSVGKVIMIIMAVVANKINSKPHTPSFCVVAMVQLGWERREEMCMHKSN